MAAAIESSDQDVNSPAPSHLNVDRVSKVSLSDVDYCSTRSHTQDNEIDTSTAERLGSDRIRVLEDHFQKIPKPGTEVKKRLAEQLELSTYQVNNWYQNRRAAASHQKPKLVPLSAANILDTSVYPMDEGVFRSHFPNIKGERLVSDLHICCIRILHEFRQTSAATSSSFKDLDYELVDEQRGRLFLWGQGFEPGKLEDAFDQSNELREMVLESLCEIGKLIIHDLLPLWEALLESPDYLPHRVQELKILITRAQSSMSRTHEPESDNEEEDAFEDVSSEDNVEVSELGVNLEFHVQCLMDLIPALQQNIAHAEKTHPHFSTEKRELLLSWLNNHMNDPYPKKHEVVELAAQTNLTENQVRDWYIRYRKRNPKRISHKQTHHSSDASATPAMTDIESSEAESESSSVQAIGLLDRLVSPPDTYLQMYPGGTTNSSPAVPSKESRAGSLRSAREAGPNQQKLGVRFSNEQRQILFSWLDEHMDYPYPKKHEVVELAAQTNLTESQVRDWYTRYRKRDSKHISHKQTHHSSDASATPATTDIDGSVVTGEPLKKVRQIQNRYADRIASLQDIGVLDRPKSPP